MTDDLRLEFPFPPKELSPNVRVGWREKARIVAQYREEVAWEAVATQVSGPQGKRFALEPPVEASVTFVVPDRRKRDLDNLLAMLKPAWDGLVDAGVLAGDDSERFKVTSAVVAYMNGQPLNYQGSCVLVVLRSLSGAGAEQ